MKNKTKLYVVISINKRKINICEIDWIRKKERVNEWVRKKNVIVYHFLFENKKLISKFKKIKFKNKKQGN